MKHKGRSKTGKSFSKPVALIVSAVFILLLSIPFELFAKPVNSAQVEKAVKGWLNADAKPLNTALGNQIRKIDVYNGTDGEPAYYIVYLKPSGFVIVSGDDLVEPVIGFVSGDTYDPSPSNPLGALISRDVPGRVETARGLQKKNGPLQDDSVKAKDKWNNLLIYAETIQPLGLSSISDVRVSPLVLSKWGQETVCGTNCYNYYAPNYYPDGCVATAMAQFLRFYQYPVAGIGVHSFTIYVNGNPQTASTRGGNGSGGAYNWSQMVLEPGCSITSTQRQAIGALCYDVGVASLMNYASGGSGAYLADAKTALISTFQYASAVKGGDSWNNIGSGLNGMINPNLDACSPVILGINDGTYAHAVVADGYGYNSSTLYHHINMGWDGYYDSWYNLPNINSSPSFNSVDTCVYNIYISGSGEIISGRVLDDSGNPMRGVAITASGLGGPYTAATNNKGIYALVKVRSSATYTVSAAKEGYSFTDQVVTTTTSYDSSTSSGNKWGIDFQGLINQSGCNPRTIGSGASTWDYPMHTYYHDSRTQVIYLASEIGHAGTIKSLALNVATIPGQVMNNWTIRMKYTSLNTYSAASFEPIDSGWTTVYQANEPQGSAGWRNFTFTTPFEYDGTRNLLIDFSHNNSSYNSSGYCYYSTPGGIRSAYAYSDSAFGNPLNWTGTSSPVVYGTTSVPNIKLAICEAVTLEADLNGDNNVDMLDYAILAAQWLQSPGAPSADIAPTGGDGIIDYKDLAVMANQWLQGI